MSDAHGHGDKPFLAHHFEDEDHQFDAGKLGIWAFLVTEVLFFSGLFCAYAIYRSMNPEVFQYAAQALDTKWGAINTCVLLFSSLTAAWAVRNAQLGQKGMLCANLALTIACAFGFMGIKYVEYSHKFEVGIKPGRPTEEYRDGAFGHAKAQHVAYVVPDAAAQDGAGAADQGADAGATSHGEEAPSDGKGDAAHAANEGEVEAGGHGAHDSPWVDPTVTAVQKNKLRIFFGIYYCMTGLHGIHVLLGIVVLTWLLTRALRGHFTPTYYGPIDFAALYWHLVDLIWIYLFPLLYLIN